MSGESETSVYRDGQFLVDLMQQPGPMSYTRMERICAKLTEHTNGQVKFDWHSPAGHPMLLYYGDYDVAVQAYYAMGEYLRTEADARTREYEDGHPSVVALCGRSPPSTLGLSVEKGGPELSGPGYITIYQASI